MTNKLPKVEDCIAYVCSLGYDVLWRSRGRYCFHAKPGSNRPAHNQIMTWTLGEMRHAVKYGC